MVQAGLNAETQSARRFAEGEEGTVTIYRDMRQYREPEQNRKKTGIDVPHGA